MTTSLGRKYLCLALLLLMATASATRPGARQRQTKTVVRTINAGGPQARKNRARNGEKRPVTVPTAHHGGGASHAAHHGGSVIKDLQVISNTMSMSGLRSQAAAQRAAEAAHARRPTDPVVVETKLQEARETSFPLRATYEHKSILFVGVSNHIPDLGPMIDMFDVVVRVDMSPMKGYEQHVGTKTTHMCMSSTLPVCKEPLAQKCSPEETVSFWKAMAGSRLMMPSFTSLPDFLDRLSWWQPKEIDVEEIECFQKTPEVFDLFLRQSSRRVNRGPSGQLHPGSLVVPTGMCCLFSFLLADLVPYITGFDLTCVPTPTSPCVSADGRRNFAHEAAVMQELVDTGLVRLLRRDLEQPLPSGHPVHLAQTGAAQAQPAVDRNRFPDSLAAIRAHATAAGVSPGGAASSSMSAQGAGSFQFPDALQGPAPAPADSAQEEDVSGSAGPNGPTTQWPDSLSGDASPGNAPADTDADATPAVDYGEADDREIAREREEKARKVAEAAAAEAAAAEAAAAEAAAAASAAAEFQKPSGGDDLAVVVPAEELARRAVEQKRKEEEDLRAYDMLQQGAAIRNDLVMSFDDNAPPVRMATLPATRIHPAVTDTGRRNGPPGAYSGVPPVQGVTGAAAPPASVSHHSKLFMIALQLFVVDNMRQVIAVVLMGTSSLGLLVYFTRQHLGLD
eukprot:jgi/Mesvir1/11739/Mv00113-RA.1